MVKQMIANRRRGNTQRNEDDMIFNATLPDGTKEAGRAEIFVFTLDNGNRIQIQETESGTLEIMARDGNHFYIIPKVSNVIEIKTTA